MNRLCGDVSCQVLHVENGAPTEDWMEGLLLIKPEKEKKMGMMDIVEVCLEKLASYSLGERTHKITH